MCLTGSAGELPLGATCARHGDCASLSCDQGSCVQPCLPGDVSTCPVGLTCQPGGDSSCGSCAEGAAPPGAVCLVNEDCATELCLSDGEIAFCTQPCGDDSPCPDGFNCVGANDAARLCLPDHLEVARPAVSIGTGLSCATAAPPSAGGIFPLVILIGCALRRRRP
jgi:MYXO-CTERM domain-containing protein